VSIWSSEGEEAFCFSDDYFEEEGMNEWMHAQMDPFMQRDDIVQMLHVWAPSGRVARLVKKAWARIDVRARERVVVICSVVRDKWVFTNKD
jgi:hypothetical protein